MGDGPRQRYRAAQQDVAHIEGGRHARVGFVVRPEDGDAAFAFVVRVLLLHRHHGQDVAARAVGQRDLLAERYSVGDLRVDGQRDGYGPGEAVREVHIFDDDPVVGAAHETL